MKFTFFKNKFVRLALFAGVMFVLLGYSAGSIYIFNINTTTSNRSPGQVSPASVGLNYEEVVFTSAAQDKLRMRGWWIPRPDSRKALIMLHGKYGDRTFPLGLVKPLWESGYNLLLYDLRGHGLSDGTHFTYGYYEQLDTLSAVDFLKGKGFQAGSIGIIGWSMGASTAIMAMGLTADIKAGVSDSAYGDFSRVARFRLGSMNIFYPGLSFTARLFVNLDIEQIKPEAALKNLGGRRLILIHGDQDTTVPVSEVYHLKAAGGSNISDTWVIAGGTHASAFQIHPAEYIKRVFSFFGQELE